jgi:hypothetical protein
MRGKIHDDFDTPMDTPQVLGGEWWPEDRNEVRTSIEFESIFWQIMME